MEQEAASGVPIVGLIMYFIFMVAGAYWHYRKVMKKGRHMGSLWKYLTSAHPGRTGVTALAIALVSWEASSSGVAGYIDPSLAWTLLSQHGRIDPISVTVAASALTGGYVFDSQINKGDNE